MQSISINHVNLIHLIDEVNKKQNPVEIQGEMYDAILISKENWRSIQEALTQINTPSLTLSNDQFKTTFDSIEEGYMAMANDIEQEKEAEEWISAECGECLPDYEEDWGEWNV